MRVYFIGSKYDGCFYVRCLLPLMANGWDGAKTTLEGRKATNEEMFDGAMKSDIVVFQRPDTPDKTEAIRLLKLAGKKIVFDNDDTYKPDSGFPRLNEAKNQEKVNEINEELYKNIRQADLITTTTETLANEYRELNPNVVVLPNCVDPFDWDEPIRNEGKVRIGLVGSVAYDDYKVIKDYLKELSDRDNVELVMFALSNVGEVLPGDNPFVKSYKEMYAESFRFIKGLNIKWVSTVNMSKYFTTLNDLKLDIMLIPRRDTYFNKCKSNIKYLEASMLEIPVVASTFEDSPYNTIEDGVTGFLAKDEDEFKTKTEILIKDKALRRQIGKNTKEYTLKHFNIENNAHLWESAYKTI